MDVEWMKGGRGIRVKGNRRDLGVGLICGRFHLFYLIFWLVLCLFLSCGGHQYHLYKVLHC